MKKEWEVKVNYYVIEVLFFIESFQVLWHKVEILLKTMVKEEKVFMVEILKMKTFHTNMIKGVWLLWLIVVQTQMDHNFILHLKKPPI